MSLIFYKTFCISPILNQIKRLSHPSINLKPVKITDKVMQRMHKKFFNEIKPHSKKTELNIFKTGGNHLPSLKDYKHNSYNNEKNNLNNKNFVNISMLSTLNMSELMIFLNYNYTNQKAKYFLIVRDVLRNIEARWRILNPTKENILQLIFFILAYQPKIPSSTLMKYIEEFVDKNINLFSFSDLSTISFGFFATNTRFSNYRTASNIANKFVDSVKLMDHNETNSLDVLYDISNILKSMRHIQYNNVSFYDGMGDVVCSILRSQSGYQVSPAYLSQLCSIIFSFTSLRIYHENLLKSLIAIFEASENRIRLKDYGRLLGSLLFFRHTENKIFLEKYSRFLDLDIQEEIVKENIGAFVECLVAFCLHQHPHQRGMRVLFSDNMLITYKNSKFEQDFQMSFLLSHFMFTNKKNKITCENTNFYVGNLEHELKTRQGLLSLLKHLYTLFDVDLSLFRCSFILPFSQIPDIELRVNTDNKIVSFNHDFSLETIIKNFEKKTSESNMSNIELLMKELEINQRVTYEKINLKPKNYQLEERRICIKVFGENQYLLNVPRVDGFHYAQLKMLQDLQYQVYVIDPNLAKKLDSSADSLNLLLHIFEELKIKS